MPSVSKHNPDYADAFAGIFSRGGEMGKLIRYYDWENSALGPMQAWPQSLRTTLGIIVNSKFPMFLFWGEELICFYNDAYRPTLGVEGKHPSALGRPGIEVWPEIWHIINPLIQQVLAGGESVWQEDSLIPIFRNGKIEDVYWTFSYSPVIDESGAPGGVLVTCNETTKTVISIEKLQISERRFENLVRGATVGIVVLMGNEMRIDVVNEMFGRLIDRTPEELIDRNIFDIVPETQEHFRPIIDRVRLTGESLYLYDYPYHYNKDKQVCGGYLNLIYQPYRELDGTITGVMILCQDVTEQVLARQKAHERDYLLKKVIEESPIRKALLIGEDHRVEMVNDVILKGWHKTRKEVLGKPIREILPEMADQPYFDMLDRVYQTGKTISGKDSPTKMLRNGNWVEYYFDYWYKPILNAEGKVYGVLGTSIDVTEKVLAQRSISQSEYRFRELVESAPFPIAVYTGAEMTIQLANQVILETWGKGNDVIGKSYTEVLPELGEEIYDQIRKVMKTGKAFHAKNTRMDLVINGEPKPFYFNYSFTPLYDLDGKIYGVMNTAADVTDVNVANQKAEQSENNLRGMILQAPVAMCILRGKDHFVEIANERMLELWGKKSHEVSGKKLMDGLWEVKGQGFDVLLDHVYATGETYKAYDVPVNLPRRHAIQTVYVDFVYQAFKADDNSILGVLVVASDVTEQVVARQKIEQSEESARLAIESAELGKYEVDLSANIMKTSERFDEIWGVERRSLPRSEYVNSIHPDDIKIRTAAHEESLHTGSLDYEARVVWQDKSVHWVRVKGTVLFNDQDEPKTLLGVIQDITKQKLFAEELTKQVKQRTAELHRSNDDLLHFAHVASHDLKEPIRKIKVFSNMLADEFAEKLPERGLTFLNKIQSATDRMFSMIDGVLSYSTLNSSEQPTELVSLNEVLENIENDLEILIQKKQAIIKGNPLPEIEGAPVLIYQLFYNLINNAIKFAHEDRPPVIAYHSSLITIDGVKHAEIAITDNGIGIEPQYAEQIFQVFSRLNAKDEYEGTGLGLALCKKIVERHHGTISASGVRGQGAVFTVVLPIKQKRKII